jgi:Zn-dependent peptidase ImmA (M78 family)
MPFRRGFKVESNSIAREIRAELALAPAAPLNPWRLGEHLAVPIVGLSAMADACPEAVRHFTIVDSAAFSAVTVFKGTARMIVHNDRHSNGRQASNLAHELSHALLLHPPSPALGCRDWDPALEDEANWLGGTLLIPDEAALLIVRRGMTFEEAARSYGVSIPMVKFRVNVSGARLRIQRYRVARVKVGP